VITGDGGEDGWTGTGDQTSVGDDRAAEVDMLYRGVATLRAAAPRLRDHGDLEFALYGVSRVLEEAARSRASGEHVPNGVHQAALDIARHLKHYGARPDGPGSRGTPPPQAAPHR